MRILHAILSQGFYGSERYCIELAIAQAQAGHAVAIIGQDGASDCAREFQQQIDAENVGAGKIDARTRGAVDLYVIPAWVPAWLHRPIAYWWVRRFSADIVHTHLNPAARRIGTMAQWLGIPHVATVLINYDAREHDHCDGLIALASWQKACFPPMLQPKVAVIHPWVPGEVLKVLSDAASDETTVLRRRWHADGAMVFGSVGRLAPEKGMDVLIAAFRAAFPTGVEPVRLVIVGEGPQRSHLEELAHGDSRVILAGPQSRIGVFYRAFDVFVSAARFEPFGIAILEAMAADLPIVVTRTDGPREFVSDDRVLWADTGDEVSLASRLKDAVVVGRTRYQYDLAGFSRARVAEAIEVYYHKLLQF